MIQTVPGRSCASSSLCCILPDIDALSKPANTVCHHCKAGQGCDIYAYRPRLCADFYCRWMIDASLKAEWQPALCHMMVYEQGPQITVLVDSAYPDVWQQAPYRRMLSGWAATVAPDGGYVIVFVGDAAVKIEP